MRLYKRGRTWWGWFYENGERVARSTKCHDRKAAEAVAREWERDNADPRYAAARKTSLTDALLLLLKDRREQATAGRRSSATVTFYEQKAGHLVRVFETDENGNHVPFILAKLEARHVDEYISHRRNEGAGENTIYKELVTLRASLRLARRAGVWFGEPAAICPIAFAPEYKPRTRALSPQELQLLLQELTPDRAARVAFIVATSASWGESELALTEDITTDLSAVLIRGTKRTTRFRTVPIVTEEARSLLEYALRYAEGTQGFMFRGWQNVRRDLIEACKRANIATCSPNDLRRTCATWLRAQGAPPDLIAPVMGHADTRMVERVYGRLSPQALAERLVSAIGPARCSTFVANSVAAGGNSGLSGPLGTAKSLKEVPRAGIEPATRGFSVLCSTD
jgi:integrase